jgi:hypothetical protein
MLKTAEAHIKKEHHVLMVKKTTPLKNGKGKKGVAAHANKLNYGPKPDNE